MPLINGMITAKSIMLIPLSLNALNLFAVTIPISSKKMARNPLKISVVKGLMPSACFESEIIPMIKLPKIMITLALEKACLITFEIEVDLSSVISKFLISMNVATPSPMATGASNLPGLRYLVNSPGLSSAICSILHKIMNKS